MTLADYIDCPCPHCGALNSIPTYASPDAYHEHLPAHAVPTANAMVLCDLASQVDVLERMTASRVDLLTRVHIEAKRFTTITEGINQ